MGLCDTPEMISGAISTWSSIFIPLDVYTLTSRTEFEGY